MSDNEHPATDAAKLLERGLNEMPGSAPSRRRGRPPKDQVITISALAPPQESEAFMSDALSVASAPLSQAPTVPSPFSDEVDLREHPELRNILPGSDSKVLGASEVLPSLEAGTVPLPSPALPGSVPPPALPPITVSDHGWEPIQGGDVVQINNPENKLYGTLFIVGDVKRHQVHGYKLTTGGKHEYLTADEADCFKIGASRVRSRNGCSPKWYAENR